MKSKKLIEAKVKDVLLQRKTQAENVADANLKTALENPEFKTTFNNAKSCIYEIAKAEFEKKDATKIKLEFKNLQNQLNNLLKNMGFSKTDLKPQYYCPICGDTGLVKGKPCACYKTELSRAILEETGIELQTLPKFETANFSVFDKNIRDDIQTFYSKMESYSKKLSMSDKKIITLTGGTGVGKTYLTQCVVSNALKNGAFTIFTTAFNLNNDMLKYHCSPLEGKEEVLEPYIACDLLVIDDFGSENILNNVTREYLYLIINERLAANKNTIITTNLNLQQIRDVYDERIFSRLANTRTSALLEIPGTDIRVKKS